MAGGVLYAFAVLCCPYLIAIFPIYTFLLITEYTIDKKRGCVEKQRSRLYAWLWFIFGASLVALILALILLTRTTPEKIMSSLSGILNDPQHEPIPFSEKLSQYIYVFLIRSDAWLIIAGCVLTVALRKTLRKKGQIITSSYLVALSVVTMVYLALTDMRQGYINYLNVPINLAGISAYILSDKRDKKILYYVFIPGWLYSFLIHLGSNNVAYCISSALNVSAVASAYFIACKAKELEHEKRGLCKIGAAILLLCVIMQSGLMVKECGEKSFSGFAIGEITRMTDVRSALNTKAETGVAKGLYMAEDENYEYCLTLSNTENTRNAEGKSVLYYCHTPWLYLMDKKENAAFSAWLSINTSDSAVDRLTAYWEVNPDKVPDVIYIDKAYDMTGKVEEKLKLRGYAIKNNEMWVEMTK